MCLHVLYIQFPLILYATRLLSEKNCLIFDLFGVVEGVCNDRICSCMVVLYVPFP